MERIMVVEDDPDVREVVCQLLKVAGFAVDGAADGIEALERVRNEAFDLVLLDVWMPRMNGLELLAQLRSLPSPPKAVVMTADDTPETMLGALRERACQYITKPIQPEALVDVVRGVLDASAYVLPIEVLSAKRDWVELLVPCTLEAAERIQGWLTRLKADLPDEIRESVGKAFRELLLNAIEWGGQLNPSRKVRIAYLRTRHMLLYRIADPGAGFRFEGLTHAALGNPPQQPSDHLRVREEKGLRPGGFGLLMARAMVDELIYNEAQNEVVFVKYLEDAKGGSGERPGSEGAGSSRVCHST